MTRQTGKTTAQIRLAKHLAMIGKNTLYVVETAQEVLTHEVPASSPIGKNLTVKTRFSMGNPPWKVNYSRFTICDHYAAERRRRG